VRRQNRKDAVLVREAAVEGADRKSATETAAGLKEQTGSLRGKPRVLPQLYC